MDEENSDSGRVSPRKRRQKQVQRDLNSSLDSATARSLSPGRQLPPLAPSRPSSIVSGPLSDNVDGTKPTRKKKQNAALSQEALVENEETPRSNVESGQTTKKKKKKRARAVESDPGNIGLATELYDLNDDIITKPAEIEPTTTSVNVGTMKSQPTNKLFIEQKSGFKVAEKTKVAQKRADEEARRAAMANQALVADIQSTTELALWTHVLLERGYKFLRGMLAGISLWQIISTYMLINQSSTDFLSNYYMLASPLQCLYFLLFSVSLVSVLDRYDVARPTYTCVIQSVTCQAGTVAVLFYFIGFVFSLATAFMDQRIGLYQVNPEAWNVTSTTSDVVYQWSILNLIRGLMAMLGFLIVCCSKPVDRLRETLQIVDKNILDIEETEEEPTKIRIETGREFTA